MSNPSKRKGTEWETAVTRYLREALEADGWAYPDVRRVAQTGRLDTGDVHAYPFVRGAVVHMYGSDDDGR